MFTKGHTINAGNGSPSHKAAGRSLAMWIRDGVDPSELRDRLLMMARGRNPVDGTACTVLDQQRAMQMLFDRGWGQAAQHVIVEGEIRTELIGQGPQIVKPTATLEQIRTRRAELLSAGVKPKIIDAESVERKVLPEDVDDESAE